VHGVTGAALCRVGAPVRVERLVGPLVRRLLVRAAVGSRLTVRRAVLRSGAVAPLERAGRGGSQRGAGRWPSPLSVSGDRDRQEAAFRRQSVGEGGFSDGRADPLRGGSGAGRNRTVMFLHSR